MLLSVSHGVWCSMSVVCYKEIIAVGDLVVVCRGYERMFAVTVQPGHVIQVKGGAVHHESLVGRHFGSKVYTSNGKNWIIVLHPTPELWTLTLPHRTQIIYTTDTSMITLQLDLRPGSVVIESGTGSGGLSHALARAIHPHGHLYTYEFHQQRAELAREEFEAHGLSEVITLECRDVCSDGFNLTDAVDAVFLDLPCPWLAIEAARLAIKESGGRLCSFSPCLEQVQRTVQQLHTSGFIDVDTVECLLRPFDVHPHTLTVPNTGVMCGGAYLHRKLVHPTLTAHTLYTAQPSKKIPGHTGFLTFATLPHKH